MTRRSQTRNQYESTTVGELAAGAYSVTVVSAAGFEIDEPIYFVIEPDVPGQREWIRVVSITGNQLNIDPSPNDHGSDGRNLAGSDGDLTHPAGSKVRSVSTEQQYLDLWADVEGNEDDLIAHIANQNVDGPDDPHANARYLHSGSRSTLQDRDADTLYVRIDVDSTVAATATIKYTDTGGFVDADLVPLSYINGLDDTLLPLDGSRAMTGVNPLDMGGAKVTNMADGSQSGDAAGWDQLHARLHAADSDLDHSSGAETAGRRLTADGAGGMMWADPVDAVQEVADADVYLKLVGDTMGGVINMDGNKIEGVGAATAAADAVRFDQLRTDGEVETVISDQDAYVKNTGDTFSGQLEGPAGSVTVPAFAVGNSTTGLYQQGSFVGLTRTGNAVIVGNGTDQLYADGIIAGVGDDIVATGTQIFRVVSSKRFKNVGERIDKAAIVAKLKALPVYEWAYKNSPDEEQIGWLAEDVAEVDPRLVNWNDEGQPSSIRTLAIMAVLT